MRSQRFGVINTLLFRQNHKHSNHGDVIIKFDTLSKLLSLTNLHLNQQYSSQPSMDYYQTLGVSRFASQKEIKTKFYELSKQYHPDINPSPEAASKFRQLAEAYNVLSNLASKKKYDDKLGSEALEYMYPEGWKEQQRKRKQDQEKKYSPSAKDIVDTVRRLRREEEQRKANDDHRYTDPNYKPDLRPLWQRWRDSFYDKENLTFPALHRAFCAFFLIFCFVSFVQKLCDKRETISFSSLHGNNYGSSDETYEQWRALELNKRQQWYENQDKLLDILKKEEQEKKDSLYKNFIDKLQFEE